MGRAEIARYLADIRPWEDPVSIRAGIRPDRRPWYARGDVRAGVPTFEALYHFIDKARSEAFYRLDSLDYGNEHSPDPDWPEEELVEFDRCHLRWKLAKQSLEEALLNRLKSGELQARGFSSTAPLDGPRQLIAAERWRDLRLDLKTSSAVGAGLTVTQILITERPASPTIVRTSSRVPADTVRKWYLGWISKNEAKGHAPARDEDEAAARLKFGDKVTRKVLRTLRHELAPASWTKRGRRSGARNRKGRDDSDASDA